MRPRVSLVLIQVVFGFILSIQNEASCQGGGETGQQQLVSSTTGEPTADGPKDYSFSPAESRVQDLVGFFEQMKQANENPFYYRNKDAPISLSEAASKLHTLSYKLPLEVKCNKYVKLISRPNIRSFGTVNELMKEARAFDDVEQLEANLVSRLVDERQFNALGRIQTILQSLESEKTRGHSDYEPEVQKDLLDCINYYVYRHQRATSSIVSYVRDSLERVPRIESSATEIVYRKFSELMANIEALESLDSRRFNNTAWLHELAKVHKLVGENNFEIPQVIQNFLTNTDRLRRLNLISEAPKRSEFLMNKIESIETTTTTSSSEVDRSKQLNTNDEYYVALEELDDLYTCYKDILSPRVGSFIQDPERRQLLESRLHLHVDQVSSSGQSQQLLQQQQSTANEPAAIIKALDDHGSSNATTTQVNMTTYNGADNNNNNNNSNKSIRSSSNLMIRPSPISISSSANRKRRLRKMSKPKKRVRVKDHDIKQANNTTGGFHCGNSLDGLLGAMQTINTRRMNSDQARRLANELVLFKSNCFGGGDGNGDQSSDRSVFARKAKWPIVSLTEKLSRWCRSRRELKDPSISPTDQASMFEVLGMLRQIMSHDKDTGQDAGITAYQDV